MRPAALLALLLLLAACRSAPAPPPPGSRTFEDDLGRTVVLPDTVRRVVPLAPSLTEVLFAAGAGPLVAGVSQADDYPPAVAALPRFQSFPMNYESIAALRPDLVLATNQVNAERDAEVLAALGIPTLFFSFDGLDDVLEGIRTVGALLGTDATATRAADSLGQALDLLAARTDTLAQRPLVLLLVGDETLYAFGRESYVHDLIARAGGRSATADHGARAPVLTEEFVLTANPDVIVGTFGDDYDPAQLLKHHPAWRDLTAVRQGRVYSMDSNVLLRPGPRLVEGAYRLARLLHPGLLPAAPAP